MSKLRQAARNRECQVRLPGICNHDTSTTVLAHVRLAGVTGTAFKSPDLAASWTCSRCHDAIDGRIEVTRHGMTYEDLRIAHLEGVIRTIYQLTKLGLIKS